MVIDSPNRFQLPHPDHSKQARETSSSKPDYSKPWNADAVAAAKKEG